MDETQLKSLSERLGATLDEIKNLNAADYIYLQLNTGKKFGNDAVDEMVKYNIIGVDKKENSAVVRVENGMELVFVKEGNYWKFSMDRL